MLVGDLYKYRPIHLIQLLESHFFLGRLLHEPKDTKRSLTS
jgi:hypothetical protein